MVAVRGSYDAAVIGGGVSGSSVILALAQHAAPDFRVALFEPHQAGPGTAYGSQPETLLMNGGARSMSMVPGDRSHLLRWLANEDPNALVPRARYGRYAADTVRTALERRPNFTHHRAEIVDVQRYGGGYVLTDDSGEHRFARQVVLAFGNFAPDDSFLPETVRSWERYHGNPWRLDAGTLEGDAAIVGSRLTAMDVLAALDERAFAGRVYLISRHGILPHVEDPSIDGFDPAVLDLDYSTPYNLLRTLRRAARAYVAQGGDWRAIVESLRNITPAIWLRWDLRERRRFLRHLQSFWAAHRYRAPHSAYQAWHRMKERGQLEILRGRVVSARQGDGKTLVLTVTRGGKTRAVAVQGIVNATGPNGDYRKIDRPLVRNMLERGLIRPDALRLGLDGTPELLLFSREGALQSNLFAIGPPMRGTMYETTAVPEIGRQAQQIARTLCAEQHTVGAAS